MRARLPLLVLVVCSIAYIASLYLPWSKVEVMSFGPPGLTEQRTFDGWSTIAQIGASAALAVAAAGALRPAMALRLPLGRCGLLLAYFAAATMLQVHTVEQELQRSTPHNPVHYQLAYGAYLGLATAGVALLTVVALRLHEILRRRSRFEAAVIGLSLALLAAYLLPLVRGNGFSFPGIISAPNTLAALGLCAGLWLLRPGAQAAAAGAVAVLTGGTISLVGPTFSYGYGAWLALGLAVTLFAVTAFVARGAVRTTRPSLPAACTAAAALLLLASLFLPWTARPGLDGWWGTGIFGAVTGVLAFLLVAALVVPQLERLVVEASLAVALFVLTLGLALSGFGFTLEFHFDFAYGAYIGFAAAGLIFVLAVSRLRFRPMDRKRVPVASTATVMSFLYLVMVVVPLWSVLPDRLQSEGPPLSEWISVASVLLSLHLLVSWIRKAAGSTTAGRRLVVIPLVLLALVTLGAVGDRSTEPNGGLVVVLSFCVVLAWLGWIEPRGFEGLRVPEAFRVDRLPETES